MSDADNYLTMHNIGRMYLCQLSVAEPEQKVECEDLAIQSWRAVTLCQLNAAVSPELEIDTRFEVKARFLTRCGLAHNSSTSYPPLVHVNDDFADRSADQSACNREIVVPFSMNFSSTRSDLCPGQGRDSIVRLLQWSSPPFFELALSRSMWFGKCILRS